MTELIDSHAHLTFPDFDKDRKDVLKRAREAGLVGIVNIGSGAGLEDNFKSLDLAKVNDDIFSTIGFHPHDASKVIGHSENFDAIKKLAAEPKVVAVGEVGLDYHYIAKEPNAAHLKKDQIECLKRLIAIANEFNLPLIIHDREAHDDTLFTLRNEHANNWGGVMHCFSGDVALAKEVLDLGYYISITGAVTFKKKAEDLQKVVKYVPIERLLVETDCPYIAPEPHRGERNEPSYVVQVAKKIAALKGLSYEDVARITTLNTRRLFHLPHEMPEGRIAYAIRQSLYLNITNRCSLACKFCPKHSGNFEVKGYNLKLQREPDIEDVWKAIGDPSDFKEVVFCGYGEPTMRLELLKAIAKRLKDGGAIVRLDTDGLGNLVHGRNILSELKGLIDSISISINADNSKKYKSVCPSKYGETAFPAVCDFIREAKKNIPDVTASAVSVPGVDAEATRRLVEKELGVKFRLREYQNVG